jgi:hypothetical protein
LDEAEAVLRAVSDEASGTFGARLVASYALGSLAHGGFCPLVSDVDVALVLEGSDESDAEIVAEIRAAVLELGPPMAERLSIFWSSMLALADGTPAGRFPPLDRLDLARHGRLLSGSDVRAAVLEPTQHDLVVGGARFTIDVLGSPERRQEILDPQLAAAGGPRRGSKVALIPVRLLFTRRAGGIGHNDAAVARYLAQAGDSPARRLVEAAASWRTEWNDESAAAAPGLLAGGALPLYEELVDDYATYLAGTADSATGQELRDWLRSLHDDAGDGAGPG